MRKFFFFVLAMLLSARAQAAVIDSSEFLREGHHAMSAIGELILNDPTSEGIEARYRAGFSPEWNLAGIVGTGSKNRKFRLGAEGVYNVIPDADGQFNFSAAGMVQYLRRQSYGSLQLRVTPIASKKFEGLSGMPVLVYVSLPITFEIHQSTIETQSQLAFGGLFDISEPGKWYGISEAGIRLAKAESYVALGVGYRFGEGGLTIDRFRKPEKSNDEYRTEDFK